MSGIYTSGLQVVTVLIGVFDVVTKQPILGMHTAIQCLYIDIIL